MNRFEWRICDRGESFSVEPNAEGDGILLIIGNERTELDPSEWHELAGMVEEILNEYVL